MTTILLVEDDCTDATLFKATLREVNASYRYLEADSISAAEACLAEVRADEIDVVLLDLALTDTCGLETLKKFVGIDDSLPIVVLTGYMDEQLALESVQAGAQDYLIKGSADAQTIQRSIRYAIERKKESARNSYLAKFDLLTGLANRAYFHTSLARALARTARIDEKLAIFFIGVDHFKRVNDTLGHAAGDKLLIEVTERLKCTLREGDTLARMGGDEFAAVIESVPDLDGISAVAEKIQHQLSQPFMIDGNEAFVSGSIGIAIYPDDANQIDALMQNADAALYQAKREGRNQYQFFKQETHFANLIRLQLEGDLHRAIDNAELALYYQPKFDLHSKKIGGLEALLRWRHREKGLISPAKFIPLAERSGQIIGIGTWVVEQVCKQIIVWRKKGIAVPRIAFNLSAVELNNAGIVERILGILHRFQVKPSLLQIEVTESAVMRDTAVSKRVLEELKHHGFSIAVDDFGTGYSSLAYLKKFPLDCLKIDRSFIDDIAIDDDDKAITQAIVALGHSLNLKIVAEGVESKEQYHMVEHLGCDEIQGYYFSEPLTSHELEPLLGLPSASTPTQLTVD